MVRVGGAAEKMVHVLGLSLAGWTEVGDLRIYTVLVRGEEMTVPRS